MPDRTLLEQNPSTVLISVEVCPTRQRRAWFTTVPSARGSPRVCRPPDLPISHFMELKSLIVPVRSTVPALTTRVPPWSGMLTPPLFRSETPHIELPSTTFVNPQIDLWNKTPQPDWFPVAERVTWEK